MPQPKVPEFLVTFKVTLIGSVRVKGEDKVKALDKFKAVPLDRVLEGSTSIKKVVIGILPAGKQGRKIPLAEDTPDPEWYLPV